MAKDSYVDVTDVGFGVVMLALSGWVFARTDDLSATLGFGMAGLVLGALCAALLRGRFATIALAVFIIGIFSGLAVGDRLPAASYGMLFGAGYGFVPRGFRLAKTASHAAKG